MVSLLERIVRRGALASILVALSFTSAGARAETPARAAVPTIRLEVDATDLPRNLMRASMTIQAAPGPMDLRFVTWTPGNHAPSGPIQNVIDLEIKNCDGGPIDWTRDAERPAHISLTVPAGCSAIKLSFRYIASQPSVTSRSTDTYGRSTYAVLNWNTALFYPAGKTLQQITVAASLGLPTQWQYATSLRTSVDSSDRFGALAAMQPEKPIHWIDFRPVPLGELIDSPVIMGRWMSTRQMNVSDIPGVNAALGGGAHFYCVVGPDESSVTVPDWLAEMIDNSTREAIALMAPMGYPRDRFYFLHAVGDSLNFGVEHSYSTLIGDPATIFRDAKRDKEQAGGAPVTVIPHEYFHAWCGKLVAPEGVVRDDYHTPISTELLWVYEGLTTYYTNILAVRGGMMHFDEFLDRWTDSAVTYERRAGRLWRSVDDTARAAAILRDRGSFWLELRQGQEYYGQGALFWLEADALIRRNSNGAKSIDDFCRALFTTAPITPPGSQFTYNRADIVRTLTDLDASVNWSDLIHERIEKPQTTLDLTPQLALAGRKLTFTEEATLLQKKLITAGDLRTSLGIRVDKNGEILDLIPSSPADTAGLAFGMKIIAVDGWIFTPERLKDAVKNSKTAKRIELSLAFGERLESRTIPYELGLRYPALKLIEGEPDIFKAIATPLLPRAEPKAESKNN